MGNFSKHFDKIGIKRRLVKTWSYLKKIKINIEKSFKKNKSNLTLGSMGQSLREFVWIKNRYLVHLIPIIQNLFKLEDIFFASDPTSQLIKCALHSAPDMEKCV